jgi:DNA ligase (NAD+)
MITEIKEKLIKANKAYREGKPIMSDSDYDALLEELELLSPNDELLFKIGHTVKDESRKVKLPIEMASMNKIKSMDEIYNWCRLKEIPKSTKVVITPKYDGLSLCVNEKTQNAYTRGDGVMGQKSDSHYKLITNHLQKPLFNFTYGEVVMRKSTFLENYADEFANPRNLVAGLLNSKDATEPLRDCVFIKYGAVDENLNFNTKSELLDELNSNQLVKVPYCVSTISDLREDLLIDLFKKYSEEFEIDGLIIEIDNLDSQEELGRETSSNNPVWARAFKHSSFEQSSETKVTGITWNISKQGYLKPIVHIESVKLDGVTVSNVTGNNARFVKDLGIGIGAKIVVKRSGMVIPLIVDVLEKVEFTMPDIPNIDWNENKVELMTLEETNDQKIKKNIAFFEILGADNVSEGIIKQLWDAGFETIESILKLDKSDLLNIDRFGERKAEIVYNSIQKSIKDVELSKLQHATGIFGNGLGSKKLALLEHFKTRPTLEQVMAIDGFAEKSAKNYIDNYNKFFDFIEDLPVKITEKKEASSDDLKDMILVFTGIRRKDLKEIIEDKGGKVATSLSKKTTHLVCKDPSSGSSKLKKAREYGTKILTVEEIENILL